MAALNVHGLTKRFGRTEAVRDVSFVVNDGEIHGLLGPNGSGKTTTLACSLGLLRPTRGSIEVLGIPAGRLYATAGRVGVVFDGANLVEGLSVRDNLEYVRRLLGHSGGRSSREVMELTGIEALASRRAGKLSLGQKKRVAVARALLGRPEFLVLDEPLAAFDTLGVDATLRLLRRLASEGLTVLLSSHRLPEMERVISHATILRDGQVVGGGPIETLLASEGTTIELRVTEPSMAHGILSERGKVLSKHNGSEVATFVVRLDVAPDDADGAIGALTRSLIDAGCNVLAAIPERRDLAAVFDGLIASEPRPGGSA